MYLSTDSVDDTRRLLLSGQLPGGAQALDQIDYAPNRAELPPGVDQPELSHLRGIVIFGVAVEDAQEDLMGERARVLAETWTSGGTSEALVSAQLHPAADRHRRRVHPALTRVVPGCQQTEDRCAPADRPRSGYGGQDA